MSGSFVVGIGDVGAAYTTFLTDGDGAALIDFGGQSYDMPWTALERMAAGWWPHFWLHDGFAEIVISHPHQDHYNGLFYLARHQPSDLLLPDAAFYHPRVPDQPVAKEFVMHMMAIESVVSHLPEFALGRAVQAVARGPVRRRALVRGDQITLAGQAVDVLWPPRQLDESSERRLADLVQQYQDLAAEAADQGDERMVEAIAAVRRDAEDVGAEQLAYGTRFEGEAQRIRPSDRQPMEFGPTSGVDDFDPVEQTALEARMKQVKRRISKGANLLSLVLATEDQRYVFLGDLDHHLHSEIADEILDRDHDLVLSAHHGTHFGTSLATLDSRYVVSSVGGRIAPNVRTEYDAMGMHLRTDRAGDITVWMEDEAVSVAAGRSW